MSENDDLRREFSLLGFRESEFVNIEMVAEAYLERLKELRQARDTLEAALYPYETETWPNVKAGLTEKSSRS